MTKQMIHCALAVVVVAASSGQSRGEWKPAEGRLMTRWAEEVGPDNALPEYPRPQMKREDWQNLNGLWNYAIQPRDAERPQKWDGEILVPFCAESALSGVGKAVGPQNRLWYRRTFEIPQEWNGRRVRLNFGAVDWHAIVRVNGQKVGEHKGGYDPFSFDITRALKDSGPQEILISVWDPTDAGFQPRGKQVREPHGIWYTAVTGIWQTVWLEPVPKTHVQSLEIVPDVDASAIRVTVHGSDEADVRIQALDGEDAVAEAVGRTGREITVPLQDPKLWSPDSPHLYGLKVSLLHGGQVVDRVESYAGLRKIEVKKDERGVNRLFLNGEVLFQYGPLDQGWWPDGLYTAATDEALKYDIEVTKRLGFNMIRKHVKVEPARWYYWCDKLGVLVWQDMPSGARDPEWHRGVDHDGPEIVRTADSDERFRTEFEQLVQDFGNHSSIVVWVPFNERWGQYDTEEIVALIRRLDPTRLVNSASGGNFRGVGDILDVHSYPNPAFPGTDDYQAAVCGEFGGLGLPVEGHTWLEKGNWGYRTFETPEALTEAYREKLAMLRPMIGKGLAAAVYTQTSDVEIEVNGLMTYDRDVIKMDPETVAGINRKLYRPPPEIQTLMPTAETEAQIWRYTTEQPDGDWQTSEFDDSSWNQAYGGFGTEGTPGAVIGTEWTGSDIWIRRPFELRGDGFQDLYLRIHHDEDAEVYLNGIPAAEVTGYTTSYTLVPVSRKAQRALRSGAKNVIAVHCHQTGGGQYIDVGLVQAVDRSE